MLKTDKQQYVPRFVVVDNFVQIDEHGRFHFGKTLQNFLEIRGYNLQKFSSRVSIGRTTLYSMFNQNFVDTDRLQRICKATNHNFFQYFFDEMELQLGRVEINVQEPEQPYGQSMQEKTMVLRLEKGKYVQSDEPTLSQELQSIRDNYLQAMEKIDQLIASQSRENKDKSDD